MIFIRLTIPHVGFFMAGSKVKYEQKKAIRGEAQRGAGGEASDAGAVGGERPRSKTARSCHSQ